MKIAVDMGHCPKSAGAAKFLNELTENRRIGYELISLLKENGHDVLNTTPADNENENLSLRAQKANEWGADLFVSIHLNAGEGTGTEVYTYPTSSVKDIAANVSASVSEELGIRNRGHKTANFTVLQKTTMGAILVEVCFVDNKTDLAAYNASSPTNIAKAIMSGIGLSTKSEPIVENSKTTVMENDRFKITIEEK